MWQLVQGLPDRFRRSTALTRDLVQEKILKFSRCKWAWKSGDFWSSRIAAGELAQLKNVSSVTPSLRRDVLRPGVCRGLHR